MLHMGPVSIYYLCDMPYSDVSSEHLFIAKKSTCFILEPVYACSVCACSLLLLSMSVLSLRLRVTPMPDWLPAWFVGPHRPHRALCSIDSPIEFLLSSDTGENENICIHVLCPRACTPVNSFFIYSTHLQSSTLWCVSGSSQYLTISPPLHFCC